MLPLLLRSSLDVQPLEWEGLPRRYMNPGELETLVALIKSVSPQHVIEIGVNVGRTAKVILNAVPGVERYTGVDVEPGYVPAKPVQRNEVPKIAGELVADDARFKLVLRRRGSLDLMPSDLHAADAVFIDGDHGARAVLHDSALARAVTRPGGIIVWHDYHDLGTVDVKQVLDAMHRDGYPLVQVEGTWLVFERIPLRPSPAALRRDSV